MTQSAKDRLKQICDPRFPHIVIDLSSVSGHHRSVIEISLWRELAAHATAGRLNRTKSGACLLPWAKAYLECFSLCVLGLPCSR